MVEPSRQFWIAAALLPAFGLSFSCASQLPDGELACAGETAAATCPRHVPVCEQRPGDARAFCYRTSRAGDAPTPRFGEANSARRSRARVTASRSFRLVEQSVAQADGTMLAAGR